MNIYIGAYLEIEMTPVEYEQRSGGECLKHGGFVNGDYCPDCGQALAKKRDTRRQTLYDLLPEEYEDDLRELGDEWSWPKPDKILCAGNLKKDLQDHIKLDEANVFDLPTLLERTVMMSNFLTNYKEAIEIIKEKVDYCGITFGVVAW